MFFRLSSSFVSPAISVFWKNSAEIMRGKQRRHDVVLYSPECRYCPFEWRRGRRRTFKPVLSFSAEGTEENRQTLSSYCQILEFPDITVLLLIFGPASKCS